MANQTSGKDGKGRELVCSFCGRTQNEVEQLIIGPGVNICKDCLDMCNNALYKDGQQPAPPRAGMPPRDRRRAAARPQPAAKTKCHLISRFAAASPQGKAFFSAESSTATETPKPSH